jgi:hypothetical protein
VNNELERMHKEAAVVLYRGLLQGLATVGAPDEIRTADFGTGK